MQKKNYKEDCKTHHRKVREALYHNGKLPRMIHIRKWLHPVLVWAVKMARIINKQELILLNDNRTYKKGPFVYACSHIGWDDIQMTFEAIHNHAWLFWGNPEYGTPHYYVLIANGAICVDTYNILDRKIAKETAIKLLKKGESLLIYPEGAWNITPDLPVMKLFAGTAEIAIKAGVDIVPVGIVQNGLNSYYVSIGKQISTKSLVVEDKYFLTQIVRDHIATEVWKVIEALPIEKREQIPNNPQKLFEDFLSAQMNGAFTIEDCCKERFHDRFITETNEAFSHLNLICPTVNTAFLFNKRNHY